MSRLDDIDLRWYLPAVLAMVLLFSLLVTHLARGEEINLTIIAKIESNNNPSAYNKGSGACGIYQITSICLKEYNQFNPTQKMARSDLFVPHKAYIIAYWYLNKRIPQLLGFFRILDTLKNRLWCYNAGIGKCKRNILPKETRNYIKKYKRLEVIKNG